MIPATRPPSDSPGTPPPSGTRSTLDPAKVFREALPSILKMARNRGFDDQGQQDIAQATGEILVERRGAYDPERGTPIQWAMGIAKRVISETARSKRTERRYIDDTPDTGLEDRPTLDLTPEERTRAQHALSLVRAALTEEQIEIFELTAEQRTAQEVADALGLTRSRVEQRIREARERLDALLKRLGEDKQSASRVRGTVLLPFVTVEDLEEALRAGRVREGLAEELWRRVVERTGYTEAGGDDAPEPHAPPPPKPPPHASSPPPAVRAPQLPAVGQLAANGARVALSVGQLGAGVAFVFLTGAAIGIGIFAAVTRDDPTEPPGIHPEPPAVILAATSSPPPAAEDTGPAVAAIPAGTARSTAAPPRAATAINPDTADEATLLQMAHTAPPARAVELANQHARRFPSQHIGRREVILIRALLALGRRSEAEARARALEGTVYEKPIADALGGQPP